MELYKGSRGCDASFGVQRQRTRPLGPFLAEHERLNRYERSKVGVQEFKMVGWAFRSKAKTIYLHGQTFDVAPSLC
jgi:hypothetical protein